MNDESDDKPFEATQKKLDDARRKGEVPKSQDLITAATYGGLLLAALALGAHSLGAIGQSLAQLLDRSDTLSTLWFDTRSAPLAAGLAGALAGPLSGWFGLPALAAILAVIVQRAFVVAPEKLQPKLSRISPLANAKNKFGRSGLAEFLKSFVKLTVIGLVLGAYLFSRLDFILSTLQMPPLLALAVMAELSVGFLAIVLAVSGGIGALDLLWQRHEHQRKNRMSRKELTDETKQTEGDPHVKQQRRQRGYDIATNRMLADVPGADVVVVNPEHYAVALKWSRQPGSAPVCVAKGVDEVAARIRAAAAAAGVPLHRDPATARALHATVEIGHEIAPQHYQAVAAAIRFAEAMRARARR